MLRKFREQTRDKRTRKSLSQTDLALKISDQTGLIITRNKVSNWESGKSVLSPQLDRSILIAIINSLHKHDGIRSLEDADRLLSAGDYRPLDDEEVAQIEPAWSGIVPSDNASAPLMETVKGADARVRTVKFEADSVLRVSIERFIPGSAPPVPSLVIGREDDLRNLKTNLGVGGKTRASIQVLTAIKGWPGVGKTTVASALVHDPDSAASAQTASEDGRQNLYFTDLRECYNLFQEKQCVKCFFIC